MESGENHDYHQSHQEMISKLVKSQEEMFGKLVKSQKKMFGKLCKVLKPDNYDDDDDDDDDGSLLTGEITTQVSHRVDEQDDSQVVTIQIQKSCIDHLYEAAESGVWGNARKFFETNKGETTKITNDEWKTALHIAVHNNQFVSLEKIVNQLMPQEALEYDIRARASTALHDAAMYGYSEIAKVLVKKNPELTQIRDDKGRVPLQVAVQAFTFGQTETVKYLYSVTRHERPSPFLGDDGARLLCSTIDANFYGK
ncbi:hypothetical protein MKW92_050463 [Papaver armeniacum]|nr:hypothetical protein MKW92_050463 [Papaver armeniacum]